MHKIHLPTAARELRDLHKTRMKAFDLLQSQRHEDEVVEYVLDVLVGKEDEPVSEPHAFEEMGMCTVCDGAAILLMWRDRQEQKDSAPFEFRNPEEMS